MGRANVDDADTQFAASSRLHNPDTADRSRLHHRGLSWPELSSGRRRGDWSPRAPLASSFVGAGRYSAGAVAGRFVSQRSHGNQQALRRPLRPAHGRPPRPECDERPRTRLPRRHRARARNRTSHPSACPASRIGVGALRNDITECRCGRCRVDRLRGRDQMAHSGRRTSRLGVGIRRSITETRSR
jgi:hypothetical protein